MNRDPENTFSLEVGQGEYTLSVKELMQSLLRRLWIIVLVTLLFVGAAVGLSLLQTPQYEASIEILVGQNRAFSESPTEALGVQQLTPTIAEAVDSQRVAEAVIERLDLQTDPEDFLENTSVEQLPETQLVQVTYEDSSPEEAQRIANAIGEEFSEQISDAGPESNVITATVWDRASLPDSPSSPDPLRNAILALIAGLVAGVALAFLLEFLDDSWHSPEEAERVSGVPTFGVVPQFKAGTGVERKGRGKKKQSKAAPSRRPVSEPFVSDYQEITKDAQIKWPIGVALMDSKERLKEANVVLGEMLGFTREELEGVNLSEFATHPDDVKPNRDLQKQIVSGKQRSYQTEKRFIKKDGQILWARLTASALGGPESRGEKFILAMVEDIGERKQAQEELRLSKEANSVSKARLDAILEGSPLAIRSFSTDGFAITRSESWDDVLHHSANGSSRPYNIFEDRAAVSSGLARHVKDSIDKGRAVDTPEIELGGGGRWFRAFAQPVKDGSGRVLEVALVLQEVTASMRLAEAEKQLEELGRIEELERNLESSEARRKKAERDLSVSRERFKSLVQFATDFSSENADKGGK